MRLASRFKSRRVLAAFVLIGLGAALMGCQTTSYYFQAVRGHGEILLRQQSCEKLLADTNTPAELKTKLELAHRLCTFAETELKLPSNGHYRNYVDVRRPYVVWDIYAAPPFSLEPKTWWYPFVGRLDYRGFYAEKDARQYAGRLKAQGLDVYVEGVEAYSTLGWFSDPLLNTFIRHDEARLAEVLFHELAHQRVFAAGDTDFNEAFATAVGEEGARRWLRQKGDAAALERYLAALRRNFEFVKIVQKTRDELEAVYRGEPKLGGQTQSIVSANEDSRHPSSSLLSPRGTSAERTEVRGNANQPPPLSGLEDKQRVLDKLQRDYATLKASWNGYAGYDRWFTNGVNNAQLNSVAAYYDLVPQFDRVLAAQGGDLEKFYAEAERLAKLPKATRHVQLTSKWQLNHRDTKDTEKMP